MLPAVDQQYGQAQPTVSPRAGSGHWLGFLVAGAAVLLLVAVLLPWVTVTLRYPPTGVKEYPTASVSGLGYGVWGWLTMVCALAAVALGVAGGAMRKGLLAGAAAVPGLLALVPLAVVAFQTLTGKANISLPISANLTPGIHALLVRHAEFSPGIGWYVAVGLSLLIIALSITAFTVNLVTVRGR